MLVLKLISSSYLQFHVPQHLIHFYNTHEFNPNSCYQSKHFCIRTLIESKGEKIPNSDCKKLVLNQSNDKIIQYLQIVVKLYIYNNKLNLILTLTQ